MNVTKLKKKIKFLHPTIYRAVSRARPFRIQLETTSICNANCAFCPYPTVSKTLPQGNMSNHLFEKIIQEGFSWGIRSYALYLFNEPFVDPRIEERVRLVHDRGGDVCLSTNASLMTEDRGRKVLAAGTKRLVINMPSVVPEEFNQIASKLDFNRVKFNVDALSKYHQEYKADVIVQVNVTPGRNEESVAKTLSHWRERGLTVCVRTALDRAGNVESFTQSIYVKNLNGCSDFRDITDIYIIYNGDVILCCQDWRRTIVLGNLERQSLKEIYYGRPYFTIRKQLHGLAPASKTMICRRCEFALPKDQVPRSTILFPTVSNNKSTTETPRMSR